MSSKNIRKAIIFIHLAFVVIMMVVLANITTSENYRFIKDDVLELNDNWQIETEHEKLESISLPYKADIEKGAVYKATTTLPDSLGEQQFLWIRSSMQDVIVTLEGKEIYRYEMEKGERFYSVPASLWLLVPIPADSAGKVVTLQMKSEIKVFSGLMNEVKLGSKASLLFHLLKEQWAGVVVFALLTILGLSTTVVSLIVKGTTDNRLTYLGLFAVFLGLWVISEARLLQFVIGNRLILGGISYVSIILVAFFFVLYVKEAISTKYSKVYQGFAFFYSQLVVIVVVLQIFAGIPFIITMNFVLLCIVITTLITGGLLAVELVKYKNENVKKLFKYILILIAILLPEALIFYLADFNATSIFTKYGILIFFMLLLRDSYFYLKTTFEKMKENELLEKLAYKDFLTDGFNRTAFERDVKLIFHKANPIVFRLVLIDLNYLKHINDSYGHHAGDTAIKTTFSTINQTFSEIGTSYRIGGDEFAVLIQADDEKRYDQSLQQLRKQLEEVSMSLPYPLSVGVGSDVFSLNRWDGFTDFYHHVDQLMYKDKTIQKMKHAGEGTDFSR